MGNLNLEFEINYDLETVRVVADHASGTALFTSGSTQITGSDAANWTSALEGRRIRNVTDGRDYTIAAIGPTPQSMSIETPYTGTTTGQEAYNIQASMHSANSFYSFLQDIFDETIQMDDEIPMSAQTPTEYTMLNGWFMDDRTSNFISGGAIQTSGLSGAVRQANFGVAGYTNAIVGDIGLFVTGTTTADTARLLDFDNSRRVWWLKVTGTVNDEFQDPDEILVVSGGTGQGTLSQKTFTGENVFANLFSIGSVVDQTQAYVFQTGSVITPWWPDESVNKMDVIVKTTEMGIERSGSNVTVFTRRYGNTYDHFTLAAPGGRNPVVLNTAADAFNTTDRNTIDALTVVSAGFGNIQRDLDNAAGSREYNVDLNCGGDTLANVYEWFKARTEYLQTGSLDVSGSDVPGQTYVDASAGGLTPPHDSTYTAVKVMPFGSYTGKFFGARGVWLSNLHPDDVKNFSLIDSSGTIQNPPNTVSMTVTSVASGDRVFVASGTTAAGVKKDTFTFVETAAGASSIVVNETIPADTPKASHLRVISGTVPNRVERRYKYSNWTAPSTFELIDSTTAPHGPDNTGYAPLIDDVVTGSSITNTLVQSTDLQVLIRVRQKGILPFEQEGTVGSTGLSVAAIRTTDDIVT